MALIQCDFFSDILGMSCSMNVILPQKTMGQIGVDGGDKFPVLYLLHGYSDDHTIWMRRTSIERYVAAKGLAVVMPAVHKSYYTDMADGDKYWTFISEEIPAIAKSFFPLSAKREESFVAGLSMGGYGALKLALRQPERFSYAASLSGVLDIARRGRNIGTKDCIDHFNDERTREFQRVFGDLQEIAGSENDLLHLASKLAKSDCSRPKLFFCCGTEDFLYDDNIIFRDHLKSLNYDFRYEEGPGGHEWGYWDANIQQILDWLPL